MASNAQKSDGVRAVERAIDVLQAFAGRPHGLKIAELEAITGIARPTLYRLVRTLERRNLLRASSDPTRYEIDVGVVTLAQTWMRSVDLVPRAEGALQALANDVGETVVLAIARDEVRIYVREIPSRHALTYSRGVGVVESNLRGASGLAILAFATPEAASRMLADVNGPKRRQLEIEIRSARTRGFATSRNAIIEGATAIAAPVISPAGRVVGSVGVFGPSLRITSADVARIGARLMACAREISTFAT